MRPQALLHSLVPIAGTSLIVLASSHAATITQTVNQPSSGGTVHFNAAVRDTPTSAIPSAGNDYVSGTGFTASASTGFGTNFTGTLRSNGSRTFTGDSLTLVGGTRFQMSAGVATVGNLILDGATIATSGSGAGFSGGMTINSSSYFGSGSTHLTTITSTIAGSGTLYLRSSDATPTLTFGGATTAFDGFTGTLDIGWLDNEGAVGRLLVDFNDAYNIANIVMNTGVGYTPDILNFDAAVSVDSFTFGANSLAAGTYSPAQLDAEVGTSGRFTGGGSLTVIPEPSAALLGGIGALLVLRRRRSM